MALQEYKCPCCGGAIEFNSSVQKMKCPYCDTEFEMETLAAYEQDLTSGGQDSLDWNNESTQEWSKDEATGMRVFVCKSCGGEIVGDENMAASACPFCDNPIVVMGQVEGQLKPDYIIPFKLDKKAAKAKFNEHLQNKKLLPKIFKSENHIDEIKGIYVPFWIFDSKADADIRYRATRVRTYERGDTRYTETEYYSVFRGGNLKFEHVPVDGSSKLADDLMESLEPFNFKDAVAFQPAYFAGYVADRYDVDSDTSIKRANQRIKVATERTFANTVNSYTTVNVEGSSVRLLDGKTSYAMYPVWLLNTTWNGQKFTFAMNGQTGKFVGNLPVDKSLAKKFFFRTFGIVSAIAFGVLSVIWML